MDIEVVTGNITTLEVDAIVNAANCGLLGGGGVDGAIHRAAGKELYEECRKLVEGLPEHRGKTGQAYLTGAGRLPCKFVIHTPGPVYRDGEHGEPQLLASCYENSLRRAEEMKCASIAFPCISTGVYGYPKEAAAEIAIRTVQSFSLVTLEKVVFCCFEPGDEEIYRKFLNKKS
jgi:O-acetyl-ADP-ribose deacetylase (regulator of RNase III)